MYQVHTEQFEGPLELLLSLIEKEKLDITRISLAKVADQYVDYLSREEAVPLEQRARFLDIASRLILLKSRALLPILSFTDEEEEALDDLEERLKEYQRFREAAMKISELFSSRKRSFPREAPQELEPTFVPPEDITSSRLTEWFRRILESIPATVRLEEKVLEEIITLEEKIAALETRIASGIEAAFSDIAKESRDETHAIVSFLALLELVRRRVFHVEQQDLFGEIRFRKIEATSPASTPLP